MYKITRKSSFTQIDFKGHSFVTTVCLISDIVSPHGTLLDILGVGGILLGLSVPPPCLNMSTNSEFTTLTHYSQKEPRYTLNRGLNLPQSLSGRFGEQKNLLPPKGFEPRIV